jgi:hypothetical protein
MTNRHDARSRSRRAFFFVTIFRPFSLPAFSETLGKITGRVEVQVQQTAPRDLALQIGLLTESVEVPTARRELRPRRRYRGHARAASGQAASRDGVYPAVFGREASRIRNSPFNASPPAEMHSVEASRSQWTGRSSWGDENQSTTGLGGAGHISARHPRGEFRRFSGLNATTGISTRAAMGW